MSLPIDFSVINPCETCLSYVFSFGWSSGRMNLLEAGLEVSFQRRFGCVYDGVQAVVEELSIFPSL